jgi:endonuclease YncB( thermonuclease family)
VSHPREAVIFDYRAALVRVVDGDSLVILLDVGMGARVEEEIRLLNVSAPERSQAGGLECRDFVVAWCAQLPARRWPLHVTTVPNTSLEPLERRTFVRYLATVRSFTDRSQSLNEALAEYLKQHPEWGSGM